MEFINRQLKSSPVIHESNHEHVLKFLVVGDSDVGKEEILSGLQTYYSYDEDNNDDAFVYRSNDVVFKITNLLIFGKRIKLYIWNASGQQFSTIFRSYSRGTQGIILVYDITNKWSFNGLDRWLKEIDQQAPGISKILVGNRQELAFKRQVCEKNAKAYAAKHNMIYSEVSPLCNFNVQETFAELARLVIERNGLYSFWGNISEMTLQDLCYRTIVKHVKPHETDNLPLPPSIKSYLKSFSSTLQSNDCLQNQIHKLKKRKSKRKFNLGRLNPFYCDNQNTSQTKHHKSGVLKATKHSCIIL